MIISINGKVFKYDIVTKECLYEFNSHARNHMILYDHDDKILVADKKQIRLWDYFCHKEEVPELVTVLDTPLKIECIKVNKFSEESGEKKGVFFYAVSYQNKFRVYFGRLELLIEG